MVKFTEDDHQYIDIKDGKVWASVTTFLHSFEPKKDWDSIARKYANKNNLKYEDVKKMWSNENKKSIYRGNLFHKKREEELLYCETINDLPIYKSKVEGDLKFSQSQKLSYGIYPELLVTLGSARICGQADYVEITKDGYINIKDYKTNKEIKMNGFTNWEGEEMLNSPLSNIPNSNYWIYALQLNMYAYIIKRNNPSLKIGDLELLHIKFYEGNDEVKTIIPYKLPNLQKEVRKAIESFKNKK